MADDPETDQESEEPHPPEPTMHGAPSTTSHGQTVLHPGRDELVDLLAALRADGYLMCLDVCAVDYLVHPGRSGLPSSVPPERFEVVYSLLNLTNRTRLRLRVQVPADDPVVPTATALHPGTEGPEREAFDMFGIRFDGHPDMTRILMPDEWVGHPLRKDYDLGRIPVQFKDAPAAR